MLQVYTKSEKSSNDSIILFQVNNAGYAAFMPIEDVTWADMERVMRTHTLSALLYSQLAMPYLKKNKGTIYCFT